VCVCVYIYIYILMVLAGHSSDGTEEKYGS